MEEYMGQVAKARRRSAARAGIFGVAASAVALLALAACTNGTTTGAGSPVAHGSTPGGTDTSSASAPSSPAASAAVITTPATSRRISPAQPVDVSIQKGTLTSVTMVNAAGKHVRGALDGASTSWHNTEVLGYSKTYTITAQGQSADGTPVSKTAKVTTLTPNNMTMPYLTDIYGTTLNDGGTYGVGMVVRVHFDEVVDRARAERTLHVTTTPATAGGWYWADDQNVYWRPRVYYAPGTKVTVSAKAYGAHVGPGLYGQADQSASFTIGAKHFSVANAKTHHVQVYFSGRLVRNMPTSMGQGGTVQGKYGPIYLWTMPGTYTVINHENPAIMSSDSYGLPANSPLGYAPEKVYWSTKISTDGIYLHELDATVWAQGHQNLSHGCLNLNYTNAKWFYKHSLIGDVVKVVHSGGPKISFNQGGQWSIPWTEWQKGSAL
jgi:lipoprotein-anchoring transpeptidase ErfK/SrfK